MGENGKWKNNKEEYKKKGKKKEEKISCIIIKILSLICN